MGIETVDMFKAVCDGCGTDVTDDATCGEYGGWSDRAGAVDDVHNTDGFTEDGFVLCRECIGAYRANLGDDDEAQDALSDGKPEAVAAAKAWATLRLNKIA